MNFGISLNPLEGVAGLVNAGASVFNTLSANNWARKNYNLQRLSQEEAMFMNRNQFQVQSADALKAGINPLAMQGGSVSSASAQNVEAPQIDLSGVNQILGQVLQAKNQKDLQKQFQEWKSGEDAKQRRHEEILASLKIDAENKRSSDRLAQEQKQFDANLDEIKRNNDMINSIRKSNISNEEKKIKLDEQRLEIERTSTDILNSLRQQQYSLNNADLMKRCRELASETLIGLKGDSAGMWGFIERQLRNFTNGSMHVASSGKIPTVNEYADLLFRACKDSKKYE